MSGSGANVALIGEVVAAGGAGVERVTKVHLYADAGIGWWSRSRWRCGRFGSTGHTTSSMRPWTAEPFPFRVGTAALHD